MEKDITICFKTTSEISNAVEKIAKEECQSVSSVIESIIYHYLKDNKEFKGIHQNRRRLERKKVRLPAFIGDSRWQRQDFEEGNILDISFGGIRLSVPKGTKLEIQSDTKEIRVNFTLADCLWRINLKCHLQWVSEFEEEVLIGATLVDPDLYAYTAMQKYLI
jgi:PilZ domain